MADKLNTTARGVHVSPGIYTREYELSYAVKSLGITKLGLVGETVKGPAFQPMDIANWREFQDVFGSTNPEKFKGSKYPKYELPYIAKSYLSESNQMSVVRVLGLGGYNAGPAWVITASGSDGKKQAVAVLRSRGEYKKFEMSTNAPQFNDCSCTYSQYDKQVFMVGEPEQALDNECRRNGYNKDALKLEKYKNINYEQGGCNSTSWDSSDSDYAINLNNYGRFTISGYTGKANETGNSFQYPVSLNPNDKDYILNVLGSTQDDGDAPIFVESLYDAALVNGIQSGKLTKIDSGLTFYQAENIADNCRLEPVNGLLTIPEEALSKRFVGQRFLATDSGFTCTRFDFKTNQPITGVASAATEVGQIYTVKQYTDADGKRHYTYAKNYSNVPTFESGTPTNGNEYIFDNLYGSNCQFDVTSGSTTGNKNTKTARLVLNLSDGLYYKGKLDDSGNTTEIGFVELDMNNYRSAYRYASTPWFVSNLKGDAENIEVNKMFRLHTISDGDSANFMIKASIENILPDTGQFDVVIRAIDDTDEVQQPLERFNKCTMIPGDKNYIGYKIGSFDGTYESKSKYVTVEVAETSTAQNSVPCGFLGYPIPRYNGEQIANSAETVDFPSIQYNVEYDKEIKNRNQYFGLSNITGVDVDLFTFKGNLAYIESPEFTSKGFHLDSRLEFTGGSVTAVNVSVDGVEGYQFECVSSTQDADLAHQYPPIISSEADMEETIYAYPNLRKFTAYFYGGFDGWDIYRKQRSNTDDFKMINYKGYVNTKSGEGYSFSKIGDPQALGLNQNGITSDWYAYLAGIRQFANPESVDINVFATPGIDYVNNKLLVEETISMIEEERADSIYVVTTPDKPSGAEDFQGDMFTPSDAVYNLEDSDIDSNYSCTYYPWVKYLDQDNNQYIYLPPTKDVVRNMAVTDNTSYPWFAPAGVTRGIVDCVRTKLVTKLADEDILYEGRINPIKTFSAEGARVWGQKNLQKAEGMLNRIAVRRLLLRIRKLISIACIGMIFDQYDSTVKDSFISAVSPILDNIRSNRGISDYRIEVDDSIEARQNRELIAKLYFKPYNALEYISIDLVLTPEGVSFSDI